MPPTASLTLLAAWLTAQPAPPPAPPAPSPPPALTGGLVTLPLDAWSTLRGAPPLSPATAPPLAVTFTSRTLTGAFDKGLLEATLEAHFEVHDAQGYLRVPLLDDAASPGAATLNGQPTSLVAHDGLYTVGVERPGRYTVRVPFFRGQEQDRFARRLQLHLPVGGVTALDLLVPEPDIEATLAGGVITAATPEGAGTRVTGHLAAGALLDLSWARRHDPAAAAAVRAEATVRTLTTVDDGLVRGLTVLDYTLAAGETDRLTLRLPPGHEVLDVTGPAVLQWRADPADPTRLEVLLRYLVADHARLAVRFQHPLASPSEVVLATVLPADGVPFTGVLGVQAPAGLDVDVRAALAAEPVGLRELPADLTELTAKPLLLGFRFTAPPRVTLSLAHHAEVTLTSTLIDELQASSVLLADGTRVTKLRLDIRNNTRQVLAVTFPPGAELTHALLDGQPVRPALRATAPGAPPGPLLFSLRQSERLDPAAGRTHVVQRNETLGAIAHHYYADPTRWPLILDANAATLHGDATIQVGQVLRIPTDGALTVEESAFVLELAYREPGPGPLGAFGRADLALPAFDVDAMKVVWHLYLPYTLVPLDFATSLVAYDARRTDLLQRAVDLLDALLGTSPAEAGGYESILQRRKGIYREENERKTTAEVVPATFPLVGSRYRFKRVLDDGQPPRVVVTYVDATTADLARGAAFALALLLTLLVLRRRGRLAEKLLALALGVALLAAAHHLIGMHRALVWGAAAGAALALGLALRRRPPGPWLAALREPWRAAELVTLGNLVRAALLLVALRALLAWPTLRPVVLLAALLLAWRLVSRASAPPAPLAAAPEVTHD